jgi:hypothetical protein
MQRAQEDDEVGAGEMARIIAPRCLQRSVSAAALRESPDREEGESESADTEEIVTTPRSLRCQQKASIGGTQQKQCSRPIEVKDWCDQDHAQDDGQKPKISRSRHTGAGYRQ